MSFSVDHSYALTKDYFLFTTFVDDIKENIVSERACMHGCHNDEHKPCFSTEWTRQGATLKLKTGANKRPARILNVEDTYIVYMY